MIQQLETRSPLTLTPALSLRESENYSQRNVQTSGGIFRTASRYSRTDRPLSPLPVGEGQGEGGHRH